MFGTARLQTNSHAPKLVSDRVQRGVFEVDAVLTEFRSADGDPAVRSKKRGEVGQAIVDFLQLVREEGTV